MPTFKEYSKFCERVASAGLPIYTARFACEHEEVLSEPFLIIKHDVEDKLNNALKLCKIENKYGIKATYYVHSFFLKDSKNIEIMKEMISLGHEIGYHYDVLDNNDGDKEKAILEFAEALECFDCNGLKIKTLCPHGNPLKKRVGYSSNKDFFLDKSIKSQFSDLVDIYITFPDMVQGDYLYITDAQYSYFYRDAKSTRTDATEELLPLGGIGAIMNIVNDNKTMVLSTHSHRYVDFAFVGFLRILMYKSAKSLAKLFYKTKLGRNLIDKFYYLAKKI